MLGRVLGDRYRVLSRLGEGGMGTVYLCEHAVLRRKFALKVLRPELGDDRELVERFRNEAIAASGIGQENVVDVVDFGAEEDGALYYVMEALEGRSLATVLREEGPLAPLRALGLLEQICRALAAAHGTGVVHRDVKPENVFIVRAGRGGPSSEELERAKVLDFGISHVPRERGGDRLTRAGAIIGTPEYMAPEQATGEGGDHRADVYAVGVIAYEILTGSLPIEGPTPIAMLLAAQTRAPEPPSRRRPGIPQELDALVLRALAKRPEDRFGSMHELAGELARLRATLLVAAEQGNRVTARLAPRPRPSRPWGETVAIVPPPPSRRARAAMRTAAAAIGVALAAAAGGYWFRGGTANANAAPIATPTATATLTATSIPLAAGALDSAPSAPVLANARAASPGTVGRRRVSTARAPEPAAATKLHEPYGAGGDLKPDPFE